MAVDVIADSVDSLQARLAIRFNDTPAIAIDYTPDGLWADFDLSPDQIAVVGWDSKIIPWGISAAELAGKARSRNLPPLPERTTARLQRFLRHARMSPAVKQATEDDRERVLAAHTTRGLATDIVARDLVRVAFVRFDARAPGLEHYVADAVRDLVQLAGSGGKAVVWLRDDTRTVLLLPGKPSTDVSRMGLVSYLVGRNGP